MENNRLRSAAKRVYDETVLWHGTKQEHVSSLRENGFSVAHKQEGATAGGNANMFMMLSSQAQVESSQYHYLSSRRKMAKDFAMFADMNQPALVRTIGVKNNFNLFQDPRTGTDAWSTQDSINPKFVLGSKRSDPGENATIFKNEMRAAGHDVSTEQAGALLREVQSDSDDDTFPDADTFIMSRLKG